MNVLGLASDSDSDGESGGGVKVKDCSGTSRSMLNAEPERVRQGGQWQIIFKIHIHISTTMFGG